MPQRTKANKTYARKPSGPVNSLTESEVLSSPVSEILSLLGTSEAGLTRDEAESRLAIYGPNEVALKNKVSIPLRFLSHFKSPLTIILMVAALISGILGQPENTIIIFFIVVVSVILDFFQEYRAEKAAEELRKRVSNTSATLRDGIKRDIDVCELV